MGLANDSGAAISEIILVNFSGEIYDFDPVGVLTNLVAF